MATLFLTCGLPASGKTTIARILERQHSAVRLTADEWLRRIHPDFSSADLDRLRARVEQLHEELATRLLSLGCNVVLDWGLWAREERDNFRELAQRVGAKVVLIITDMSFDDIRRRISHRNLNQAEDEFRLSDADVERALRFWQPPTREELELFDPISP